MAGGGPVDSQEGRVAKQWASYRESVMHPDAGVDQVRETRMAFYAGCEALFAVMMTAFDPGPEPTEADMAVMEEVHQELQRFAVSIAPRRTA